MSPLPKTCPRCGTRYDALAVFCQRDGTPLAHEDAQDPWVGRVVLDQFRIEERIGAGGMGIVYRAHQVTVGREVAIKILHPDMAENADAVRRFHREARVSTALDHPNIVRTLLFGQLPDGSLYLVMELLRGETLSAKLEREGRIGSERALHLAEQIAEAVGQAHAAGIVHRDLKPDNVFVTERGRDKEFVKILDFGIARLTDGTSSTSATQAGLVFGTARYISPEGAAGLPTDARSDVYSIGVMLYQMLAGSVPFEGPTVAQFLTQHIEARPRPLREVVASVHAPLEALVMRLLAKRPDARPSDGAQLALELRALREGVRAVPQASGVSSVSSAASRHTATIPGLERPSRARWGAVGALAVLLGVAAFALSPGEAPAPGDASLHALETALAAPRVDPQALRARFLEVERVASHDPRLDALRTRASVRIRTDAEALRRAGDLDAANRALRIARAIDPACTVCEDVHAPEPVAEAITRIVSENPATAGAVWIVVVEGVPRGAAAHVLARLDAARSDVVVRAELEAQGGRAEARLVFPVGGRYLVEVRTASSVLTSRTVEVTRRPGTPPPVTTQGTSAPPSLPSPVEPPRPPEPLPAAELPRPPEPDPDPAVEDLPPAWTSQG